MPAVYPITLYAPEAQAHYQHMARRDLALWEKFLRLRGPEFLAFSYDVALGGVIVPATDDPPEYLRGYQYSTALKIDAVGWQANQAWIIEVRPEVTTAAFGAAVVYTMMARREKLTQLPLIPTIVCEAAQLDVAWACAQTGVQIIKI